MCFLHVEYICNIAHNHLLLTNLETNMKKQIMVFVAVIGLSGCHKTQADSVNVKEESHQVAEIVELDVVKAPSVELDFVKTFEGQIDNKYDIVLKITSNSGQMTGSCFYKKVGTDLQIKGHLDHQGQITLNEYDSKGNQTGLFSGVMVDDNKIEGNWAKPNEDSAMPFVLIESKSPYESLKIKINDDQVKSISGKYEYKSGESYASVDIEYKGNKEFTFEMSTENGIRCTGEVSGTATIDESGIGNYSSDDCESLTFRFTSTKLTIDETECDDLHGLGCWFSGNYLKAK